jgi:hypothetical protein
MAHGIALPSRVRTVGKTSQTEWNQCHDCPAKLKVKRKKLVWDIDHKLQEDLARPVIYHLRAATCWQPEVKGLTMMTNSQYNGWRFEDVWLDK